MKRNIKHPRSHREKAVAASLHGKDAQPILELRAEHSSKYRRALPSQRSRYRISRTDKRGYYPNLGGTTD